MPEGIAIAIELPDYLQILFSYRLTRKLCEKT